ncbi:MAG: DUF6580 family putative transport protein [Candidatus Thermoplasmatota archaeon]
MFWKNIDRRALFGIGFIIFGVLCRVVFYKYLPAGNSYIMFDMFAFIAGACILAGATIGGVYSFIVPFAIMGISDLILGNNLVLLFTWSGFAFIGLMGYRIKNRCSLSQKFVLFATGTSVVGAILYDLWTNFGWWLITPYYPHTIEGLGLAYFMGLPFMLGHILTTIVVLPIMSIIVLYLVTPSKISSEHPIEKKVAFFSTTVLIIFSLALIL